MTDKIFENVDFALLERQRTSLAFVLAAADKEVRSFFLEQYLEDLEGIQNFLDHVTDTAAEIYGEEVVYPMMTSIEKAIDEIDAEYEGE